ncbi:histidine phosphatase family protein [Ideonella azotifigens]|uniref:Phosphohistidine phosphatase SixA n=1 Tax=Ideonella azotifigens TaxID=513160 RepID=A0ABP3VPN4_9BURK|nr:histidine phosphatase family protein [Ideonella azotifigens]MCD2343041.1 histidine phosphatase family protein [Ideonella azotifigens]
MDLILWRHAEADETAAELPDLERALTTKGERHARRVGEWLNRFLPERTRVLVSPAKRTQQTAHALGRRFKTVETLGPDGTVEGLLAAARWPDAKEPVLVVGHQPTLGLAAAYLMIGPRMAAATFRAEDGSEDPAMLPWAVKKGGVWWLRYRPREERGEVVLVAVRTPEQI